MAMWRRWFGVEKQPPEMKRPPAKKEDAFQTVDDAQPHNPFSEARLLYGHLHSVLHITLTDSKRFVTVSEDHLVIVWDTETGSRLQVLQGHQGSVTCALPLQLSSEKELLMTGSLDSTLRLWSLSNEENMMLQDGPCVKVITDHQGPVKCLVQLNHNLICSGGRDLCIWDCNGVLLDRFDRSQLQDTSDVHSVLKLDTTHLGVVTASDYKCLAVYDIEKPPMTDRGCYQFKKDQKRRYLPQSHNYPITTLTSISATFFASGSRGGVIIVWSVQHLNAMKILHCLPQPLKEVATTPTFCEVTRIQVVSERYVFASVGCGFKMFDVHGHEKDQHGHPKPLVSHSCAHLRPLTCLHFLEDRSILLTASEDKTVRLWGSGNRSKREGEPSGQQTQGKLAIENFMGIRFNSLESRKTSPILVPLLLGEMLLHTEKINVLEPVSEHGIVTGGVDGSLILWKDGERERERRDEMLQWFLLGKPPPH